MMMEREAKRCELLTNSENLLHYRRRDQQGAESGDDGKQRRTRIAGPGDCIKPTQGEIPKQFNLLWPRFSIRIVVLMPRLTMPRYWTGTCLSD
jgi:hypothetical protein